MKNTNLLLSKDTLNDFTTRLRYKCATAGPVIVELRDDTMVKVEWYDVEEYGDRYTGFRSVTRSYHFYPDGSALSSHDHDIISFDE